MHTTIVSSNAIEGVSDLRVHHNGDWSGNATVTWLQEGKRCEVELPGKVLLAIAHTASLEAVRSQLITFLEELEVEKTVGIPFSGPGVCTHGYDWCAICNPSGTPTQDKPSTLCEACGQRKKVSGLPWCKPCARRDSKMVEPR